MEDRDEYAANKNRVRRLSKLLYMCNANEITFLSLYLSRYWACHLQSTWKNLMDVTALLRLAGLISGLDTGPTDIDTIAPSYHNIITALNKV